ncbi:MAG: N-acetylglucosamine kinase [Bacteroidetes bacterium]|nr:N-acetylglucosamine kinase [Bacteroidota bacterium]MBS1930360.1 N-acetylglucosamine kinase [Bacteroidota bacterium]
MALKKLIADSGATKAEWCLLTGSKPKTIYTAGISPYFLNAEQIKILLLDELKPTLKNIDVDEIFYYGTGCVSSENAGIVKKALQKVFPGAKVHVDHDLAAAAKSVCGRNKGMVGNLGTGSFCCYYDGKKIAKQTPGIGYALGDEGSGAYLGKKVIQYYLYGIFDEDLRARFDAKYVTNRAEILENVYKKALPNRYLASFTLFLAENRGHYMVENIIEDGLNDFFFNHLSRYKEAFLMPVHFVGGVAFGFQDVLLDLCATYQMEPGKILKNPMPGLIEYHS